MLSGRHVVRVEDLDNEEMDALDEASTIIQPLVARLISYKAPARLTRWCLKSFDVDMISKVEGSVLFAVVLAKVELNRL